MRKCLFVLAAIAASSSIAFAAEVTKDKAHIPAVKATTMSDADMDKVTAGSSINIFTDSSGIPTGKETGSFLQNNLNGTVSLHFHIANPQ